MSCFCKKIGGKSSYIEKHLSKKQREMFKFQRNNNEEKRMEEVIIIILDYIKRYAKKDA